MRKILYGEDARKKLVEGAEMIYKAVATTLGPKGKNVAIDNPWANPAVVHDGVTVAQYVESEDPFVNLGIKLVREAALKTNEEAGDGTTTSTLLAYHLVQKGMDLVGQNKRETNAMVLRRQIEDCVPLLLNKLDELTTPIKDEKDIERIAFISSQDEIIGKLVAAAINKVGKSGVVTPQEGGYDTTLTFTEGMQLDNGFKAPHFITNPQRMESVIEDPVILVLAKKLSSAKEIMPLLAGCLKQSKNIAIIGELEGDALSAVILNKTRGNINAVVVDPPSFGPHRENLLEDIAVVTGATVITDSLGIDLKQISAESVANYLGTAKTVIATNATCAIIEGKGEPAEVAATIANLENRIAQETVLFEKEKAEERLAKLTTGVGVISVGAHTPAEMREKIERVKDAIGACKAALAEGIVPGGGIAFMRIASAICTDDGECALPGQQVMWDTLQEPILKLLINSGYDLDTTETDDILEKIETGGNDFGYNVATDSVEDLVKAGVIDPAKVIRLSLQNAVSVASSILSTECSIIEIEEKVTDEDS